MSRLRIIRVRGKEVGFLPVVKGLKSEADLVKEAFESIRPDGVAISISKEEVEGLRNMPPDFELELSRYEEIYAAGLSRFGEVAVPPPCFVAAVELADHAGIRLMPVDLDEASYTELYCAVISGSMLFRHSTRTWLLRHRRFRADTPEEFVVEWDKRVNSLQGFRTIEAKRAEAIANGILKGSGETERLLAIVELERAAQVLDIVSGFQAEE